MRFIFPCRLTPQQTPSYFKTMFLTECFSHFHVDWPHKDHTSFKITFLTECSHFHLDWLFNKHHPYFKTMFLTECSSHQTPPSFKTAIFSNSTLHIFDACNVKPLTKVNTFVLTSLSIWKDITLPRLHFVSIQSLKSNKFHLSDNLLLKCIQCRAGLSQTAQYTVQFKMISMCSQKPSVHKEIQAVPYFKWFFSVLWDTV